MATNFKGITIQLDVDSTKFDRALKDATRYVDAFDKRLKQVNDALKLNPKNVDLLTSKTQLLGEKERQLIINIEEFQRELNKLKADGVENTDSRIIDLATNIEKAKEELKKTQAEMQKADSSIVGINARLDKTQSVVLSVSDKLKKLGENLKWISGLSAAALGGATKVAIDYESAFASVRKTVDETANISYEDLSESIREMARELPSTASEIAEVVALAGQLGVRTEDVMKFSKAMIDLGNSTNLTAEESATMVAQFFNVTHGDLANVENFSSALVELGNNSATTEADIMQLAFRLAGAADNLGFTQQQILALATALSSAGLKAEAAGGSMSTVLQNIQKEVSGTKWSEANEGLKVWGQLIGTTGKEFKRQWSEDAFGTFQKVIQGLGTFKDEGGDVTSKLAEMGIETIRTTDSMSRLASAYQLLVGGGGNEGFVNMANRAFDEGTALQTESAKRYETTASKLKILYNNLKDTGIELGEFLLPTIKNLTTAGTKWLKKLREFVSRNKELTATTLTFVSALAPTLLGVSKLGSLLGNVVIPAVKGLITGFAALNPLYIGGAAALAALTAGLWAFSKRANSESYQLAKASMEYTDQIRESQASTEEYYETLNKNASTRMNELSYYQQLADELMTYYEKNGKVKKGYEDRVAYIQNELAQAGIIEREDIGKSIKKQEEYKKAIDDTIKSMEAQALMETQEGKYTQAIKDRAEATDWLIQNVHDLAWAKEVDRNKDKAWYMKNLQGGKMTQDDLKYAESLIEQEKLMQAQSKSSNFIISTTEGMREAIEKGEYQEAINQFNLEQLDLVDKGTGDILKKYVELRDKIEELKAMDNGTGFYADSIAKTQELLDALVAAVGLDVAEIERMLSSLTGAASGASVGVKSIIDGAKNSFSIPNTGYRSGGFGYNTGGFVSNVTINVNNNGKTISANEVRRWASIINEQLGGSF